MMLLTKPNNSVYFKQKVRSMLTVMVISTNGKRTEVLLQSNEDIIRKVREFGKVVVHLASLI